MIQKPERDGLNWTPGDDQYLLENAGILRSDVIARHLRRCVEAVQSRASRLGVSLVRHICHKGHNMTKRPSGVYVCNVCHAEDHRQRRRRQHESN